MLVMFAQTINHISKTLVSSNVGVFTHKKTKNNQRNYDIAQKLRDVQKMIQKLSLETDTVQMSQSPTKNIVSFVLKYARFALKILIDLHQAPKVS